MATLQFAWGLTRGDVSDEDNLVEAPGLITYNCQSNHINVTDLEYSIRDLCAIPENENDIACVMNKPTRSLYMSVHSENIAQIASIGLSVRVVYDVVSLTSSEQAELFQYCCG